MHDQDSQSTTGAGLPGPETHPAASGREAREREAAWRRADERARVRDGGREPPRDPYTGLAPRGVAHRAFAALAENVRDYAIFLLDPDGVITFWGEGARLIKWWTREQAEGAHLRLLYPDGGSDDGTAEEHLAHSAEHGEYSGEGLRQRSDGSTFWAGVTLTALRGDDGSLLGFAKVTRDLTAHRAAESTLRAASEAAEAARREAEAASRAKSLFLATMSHEIRTPINAVMGYVDLLDLELAGPLTEKQRAQLGRIRASSMHLLGIVDEVLDFSRLEAGRTPVDRSAVRLGAPIDAALAMVQMQAQARGIELMDAVSGFAAGVAYWGDENRVRQILVILLSNATKFTELGGRITVSAGTAETPPRDAALEGPGPWAYIRVEDTGSGIPADRLAHIFEPFEQADMGHTRPHGGTGLGLTIARRLARLMGGDLTVRSEVGMGSAFFLWLPAAPEEAAAATLAAAQPVDAAVPGILQDVRDAVFAELERILHGYVARLRSDPATPSAHALSEPELEDHLATFLSDIAQTMLGLDLAAGWDSQALRDGTAIQRTLSERHGIQRLRLGWGEAEVQRDFEVLCEELFAAVRRRVHRERPAEVEEALAALREFLVSAERISVEAYRRGAEQASRQG